MARILVTLLTLALCLSAQAENHCANYQPGKHNLYWGDLHTHSAYSFDAFTFGTRMYPADSYAFAKGTGGITLTNGRVIKLDRPLDFLAATDHSEFLGAIELCSLQKSNPLYYLPYCVSIRKVLTPILSSVFLSADPAALGGECANNPDVCQKAIDAMLHVMTAIDLGSYPVYNWQRVVSAAKSANAPCSFTSFNAYEYSLSQGGAGPVNLHRNVIFANDNVPIKAFDSLVYPTTLKLWDALGNSCNASNGCDVVTIPHNSNGGAGLMFDIQSSSLTENQLRAKYEPLVEIIQGKGSSECLNPGVDDVSSPDCNFEIVKNFGGGVTAEGWAKTRGDYVRTALGKGLQYYQSKRLNPMRVGFVGATDNHNAAPAYVGDAATVQWFGNHGSQDDTPEGRLGVLPEFNPGGITGIWAEENTRPALFAALKAKRTYATSGPRIAVKFFQTWNTSGDPCTSTAYPGASDVLMGSNISIPSSAAVKPRFVVNALMDKQKLARVDIIKSSVDSTGKVIESQVNLASTSPGGDASLCRVWTDPSYDPKRPAFYYARVLEVPTYRWSHYDCQKVRQSCTGEECPDLLAACNSSDSELDKKVQQRAYTSPIYNLP